MTTNNSVGVPLSGASGTGHFAGTTSPIFVTPTLGAATAASVAFSPTTQGIIGTTAADNAGAGYVGQYISQNVPMASSISLTTTMAADITTLSLTAGDWDIFGNVGFSTSGVTNPNFSSWLSLSSATTPDLSNISVASVLGASIAVDVGLGCPFFRVNVSTTTTVYLSCLSAFTGGTVTACGSIFARRVR